jgi:hypothetical protein
MITLSPKELAKWKKVFAKDGIQYKTDEEYVEAVNNLVGYFDILIQMDLQQKDTAL